MKKFFTFKNSIVFFILNMALFILADHIGNGILLDITSYLLLPAVVYLLISALIEIRQIKPKKQKIENNELVSKNIKENDFSGKNRIVLLFMLVTIILSPILRNTWVGFALNYGAMFLGAFKAFGVIKKWTRGAKFSKSIFFIFLILTLILLILSVIYFRDQFEIYKELWG